MDDAKKLAARLRKWYSGGEKGMMTVCEEEDVEGIKKAINRWFELGHKRFEAIVDLIEKLDEPR